MPTVYDFAYLAFLFVLITLFEGLYFFPRFKAAVAAGVPHARVRAYRRTTIGQWVFSAIVIIAWIAAGRSWTALGLVPPRDWRLWVGIVVIAAMVYLSVNQTRAINRLAPKPQGIEKHRGRLTELEYLLPHTRAEFRGFMLLSFTAGVCEELLCRGYLMWALRPYMNVVAAIAVSAIVFGLGHAYQGKKGIVKTGVVGIVMNIIVLATGWLLPAMVVHALVDASAGHLGYTVLRQSSDASHSTM
jgi:membrane protease YdiL (CAAX protease family)